MSVKLTVELANSLCTRLNKEVMIERRCIQSDDRIEKNYHCGCSLHCLDSDCKMAGAEKPNIYVELP